MTKGWLQDPANECHSIPQFMTGLRLMAGRETYRRTITVPPAVAFGPAEYSVTLDYICNPLQNFIGPIRVTSPAIKFSIVPSRTIMLPGTGADG
ncbi:hypothetical protein [Agrobacterium sp. lyk4-40-TYG-31]|uniref:hypothetical protein n=1 Tax=Agrobacterium sp. lyk4-40-TYG-31 TaxID=3040276 RepID=UPI0013AEE2BC|nr:hypothetical protein [Agrobacterium sp. lyk4-40-TYG-31]